MENIGIHSIEDESFFGVRVSPATVGLADNKISLELTICAPRGTLLGMCLGVSSMCWLFSYVLCW